MTRCDTTLMPSHTSWGWLSHPLEFIDLKRPRTLTSKWDLVKPMLWPARSPHPASVVPGQSASRHSDSFWLASRAHEPSMYLMVIRKKDPFSPVGNIKVAFYSLPLVCFTLKKMKVSQMCNIYLK